MRPQNTALLVFICCIILLYLTAPVDDIIIGKDNTGLCIDRQAVPLVVVDGKNHKQLEPCED